MADCNLSVTHVEKNFRLEDEYLQVLDDISLEIKEGEFISIVGASGCGKSTLIRIIAGLERPTSGEIFLGKRKITEPSLDIGMVFQEARLLPWLSVEKKHCIWDFG